MNIDLNNCKGNFGERKKWIFNDSQLIATVQMAGVSIGCGG